MIAWFASVFSFLYYIWLYATLSRQTEIIIESLPNMSVELPASTRLLILFRFWLYPLLFLGSGILLITKEFFVRDKRLSLIFTLAVAVLVLFVTNSIKDSLFLPFVALVEKLK